MARKKENPYNGPGLYDKEERQRRQRLRRRQALFIPRFLREVASDQRLGNPAPQQAYEIALRWRQLETDGHLPEYKETSIDTQFLDQLFGVGLGYQLKTTSPDAWQLEHKFYVSDVGTADAALGEFGEFHSPAVVIELKGAKTDLDRDRFNGRTAVHTRIYCPASINTSTCCPT
jgi:hypothetical protein